MQRTMLVAGRSAVPVLIRAMRTLPRADETDKARYSESGLAVNARSATPILRRLCFFGLQAVRLSATEYCSIGMKEFAIAKRTNWRLPVSGISSNDLIKCNESHRLARNLMAGANSFRRVTANQRYCCILIFLRRLDMARNEKGSGSASGLPTAETGLPSGWLIAFIVIAAAAALLFPFYS